MKKISLAGHIVEEVGVSGQPEKIEYPFNANLIEMLFNPQLKLQAKDIIEREPIYKKIKKAKDFVLLEDAEYNLLKHAIENTKGLRLMDIEMVKRVQNAEDYEVKG
jgi:hypothetical protein